MSCYCLYKVRATGPIAAPGTRSTDRKARVMTQTTTATRTITHWIGGAPYTGDPAGRIPVENPATGQVEAELLAASRADLDHAVNVAREAQAKSRVSRPRWISPSASL